MFLTMLAFTQMNITAERAAEVVSVVSEIVSDFVVEDQVDANFGIIANVYDSVGCLINDAELNATNNVS